MTPEIFKVCLMGLYVGLTFWLSFIGMKKAKTIQGFAIGNNDMNPYLVGITLAASIASTATFVINPGFVYVHGLSAYLHFGVAASSGILVALLVLTKRFKRLGEQHQAITIPDWLYHRYQSRSLAVLFALINLLSVTFVVLILVGCSLLFSNLFPVSQNTALVLIVVFVFAYVLMGGVYAHAYTNTIQGIMMLVIAAALAIHGAHYFEGNMLQTIAKLGQNYASPVNPDSNLYYSVFSVFVAGFVITFALMLQPHILTKTLYLKSEKDTNRFIITAAVVGFVFAQMLLLGFYAKLAGLEIADQDTVVVQYLLHEFGQSNSGQYLLSFIFVTLLAAGMSTLDGILVSLSSMVVKDLYLPFAKNSPNAEAKALSISRIVLVAIGLLAAIIAANPPALIGLFAQKGVYTLAAASAAPILYGVLFKQVPDSRIMMLGAFIGGCGHLTLNMGFGVYNPAESATYAIFASLFICWLGNKILALTSPAEHTQPTSLASGSVDETH